MNLKPIGTATLLALAIGGFSAPLFANGDRHEEHHSRFGAAPTSALKVDNAIHVGSVTADDAILADSVASALASDSQLDGATVTLVAKDGAITMTGSARDTAQAARMVRIAKNVPGARKVIAQFDSAAA